MINRLTPSRFTRNVATLAGGAALAQFIPLLASPLLTRLYTPQDFGLLALYIAWLSNLAVIATARYELAVVLPDDTPQANNLMALSLSICTTLSLLLLTIIIPLQTHLSAWAGQPSLRPWLIWLPLSLLLAGGMQAYTSWNNRHRRYRANAAGRIAQGLGMTVTQLLSGFAGFGAAGLLLGQLVGQALSLVIQASQDILERCPWRTTVTRNGMKQAAQRYSEFPRINTPHAFTAALQDTLTVTLLTVMTGSLTVGLYGLMMRVLKLPAALVGQAVAQVTYRDMAEAKNTLQPLAPLYFKTLRILLLLVLPPALLMLFAGPWLFSLVFGPAWREAGMMAAALSPYMLCHFIASPLGMIPLVIDRQRTAFAFTIVSNILFLGALAGGLWFWDSVSDALWLVSAVMVVYFVSYFYWLYRAVQHPVQ